MLEDLVNRSDHIHPDNHSYFQNRGKIFFLDVDNLPAWCEQTRSSSHDRIHASMSILPKKGPFLAVIAAHMQGLPYSSILPRTILANHSAHSQLN